MNPPLAFAITTTAISGLLLFCWIMEMRTIHKLRDGHIERTQRMQEEHAAQLCKVHHEAWCEGVKACKAEMAQKRDKAGRFA